MGNPLSFRNVLRANGGLEVWQRGAGASASIAAAASTTAYAADRWYIKTGASGASHVSAQTGLTPQSQLCAQVQRDSGQTGTATHYFAYPLDTDEILALCGTFHALSFWLATGADWSPSGHPERYRRGPGPVSVQGDPVGLNVNLYVGTGAVAKRNSVAFTNEMSLFSVSLLLPVNMQNGGIAGALGFTSQITTAASAFAMWNFKVPKRIAPAITTFNPSVGNANWRDATGGGDVVVTVDPNTAKSVDRVFIGSQTTALTAVHNLYIHASADAGI